MENNSKRTEEKIRRGLRYSILDGSFYAAMVGFGESFFSAFAVFLKANNIQLGLLGSLPQALGSVSELFSNKLLRLFNSRKKMIALNCLLQALMYIPILLVFFLGNFSVPSLILFVCIYWMLGMVIAPAWTSWMGDLVSEKQRGSYFGKRNKITGIIAFLSMLSAGLILYLFSKGAINQYFGFALIFLIALLARFASVTFLSKQYEPEYKPSPKADFSLIDFIKQARFKNYGLFTLYLVVMNFSVFLAAPFFTPYMLYDLKFNYLTFTIIHAVAIIAKFLSMPIWGKASDRFGTRKILSLSGFLMPIVPLLWLFSKEPLYLIIVQAISGFLWAGFEISSFNFIFDTTSPIKRTTCVAYLNVLTGIAIFSGGLIGGFIVRYNDIFWSKYLYVFLLSSLLRYFASLVFVPKLKEVRIVENIPYSKLFFKITTTMPTMGLVHGLITMEKQFEDKLGDTKTKIINILDGYTKPKTQDKRKIPKI